MIRLYSLGRRGFVKRETWLAVPIATRRAIQTRLTDFLRQSRNGRVTADRQLLPLTHFRRCRPPVRCCQ